MTESTIQRELLHHRGFEIACGGRVTDAAAVDALSGRVARNLVRRGVRPGDAVLVRLPRTERLFIALLGAMRGGVAPVPVGADTPAGRVREIEALCQPRLTIDEAAFDALCAGDADIPIPEASPDDPALILFTSGSTGMPKGVRHSQRSLYRILHAFPDTLKALGASPVASISDADPGTVSFFIFDFGGALFSANRAIVTGAGGHRSLKGVAGCLERGGALFLTPSKCRAYLTDAALRAGLSALGCLTLAGERVDAALTDELKALCADTLLLDEYGSTECGLVRGLDIRTGRELRYRETALLNGEICVADDAIFDGYLGGEKPVVHIGGRPFYPMGDMGDIAADGTLRVSGRSGRMIKRHGVRVELDEIEIRLGRLEGVGSCAVDYLKDRDLLAAWCTGECLPEDSWLRERLARELPPTMLPDIFARLEALPMNANGKLDRMALKQMPLPERGNARREASDRVEALCRAAKALTGVEASPDDALPLIGIDSLKGLRLVDLMDEAGYALTLSDLAVYPVIADLAERLEPKRPAVNSPAIHLSHSFPVDNPYHRYILSMAFANRRPEVTRLGALFLARADFDAPAFEDRVRCLMHRHPALRSRFERQSSGFIQTIGEEGDPEARWMDLRRLGEGGGVSERQRSTLRFFRSLFDQAPGAALKPLRAACFRLDDEHSAILLDLSHAVADGMSLNLLKGELLGVIPSGEDGYMAWQAWRRDDGNRRAALEYFRERLTGATPATAPPPRDPAASLERLRVPLGGVADDEAVTPFISAALRYGRAALSMSGPRKIAFHVAASGRGVPVPGIRNTVGCLAHRMPVTLTADMAPSTFAQALYEAQTHQCVTPEDIFEGPSPITLPCLVSELFFDTTAGRDLGDIEPQEYERNAFNSYLFFEGDDLTLEINHPAEPGPREFFRKFTALLHESQTNRLY